LQVGRERLSSAGRGNISDLGSLIETEIKQDGKRFVLRSKPPPTAPLIPRNIGETPLRRQSPLPIRKRSKDTTF
jgi:hypothetical protein